MLLGITQALIRIIPRLLCPCPVCCLLPVHSPSPPPFPSHTPLSVRRVEVFREPPGEDALPDLFEDDDDIIDDDISMRKGLRGRVHLKTRCMWVDRGKLTELMQAAATTALEKLRP